MQLFDTIFYITLLAVIVALGVLWGLRLKKMRQLKDMLSRNDSKSIISKVLKSLNIKVEWTKDKDNLVARYTYQGGHFNIQLVKNSPFARLTFLYFYQTDIDNIEAVRIVCNLCNLNTDACRIVYTVNEKDGNVDIHLLSVLPVNKEGMKDMLERVMSDSFRWQNTFTKRIEEHLSKGKGMDVEKAEALYERDLQLIREQEMTHQEAGPDWHESPEVSYTLGDVLSAAMGLTDIIPTKLAMASDGQNKELADPDDILAEHVSSVLIANGDFVHRSAFGKLDYYDPRDPLKERHLTLDFEMEEKAKDTLYYRITMALAPVALSEDVAEDSEERQEKMTSVLLGYDLTPSADRQAQFRYIWKEAMAKKKNGNEEDMTPEEKLLAGIQDSHIAENFYHGRRLYLHKRYYEALLPLGNAFREVTSIFDRNDKKIVELINELAYFIGCCYMCLHQYEKANYYLQLTLPTSKKSFTEAYINCLVNGRDYRAMDVINGLLASLQMMLNHLDSAEDDEDGIDGQQGPSRLDLERFISFIKRRKAYLLISDERYDEAERLLKQLLDDPENSDFALSELAYIQKKK